jgi:hypothetical protein
VANYSTEAASPAGSEGARQVAEHFRALQGLRAVPLGIWLLLFFVVEMLLPLSPEEVGAPSTGQLVLVLVVFVVSLLPAILAFRLISAWYERRFGRVEPTRHQRLVSGLMAGGGVLLFVLPLSIEQRMWVSSGQSLPVNLALLGLALMIIGYWWYLGHSFHYYLAIAGIAILLGAASLVGLPPATWPWHFRELTLYIAVICIVGGLLDHRTLSRSLTQLGDSVGKES